MTSYKEDYGHSKIIAIVSPGFAQKPSFPSEKLRILAKLELLKF